MIKKTFLQVAYVGYKCLAWTSLHIFYSEMLVLKRERLDKKGAMILMSNHPNTAIDPLIVAVPSGRMVHFLAKIELFGNVFMKWFFTTFYCIPIGRPGFLNGKIVDNTDSFKKCDEFLMAGGCLYVGPEGTSIHQRHLLPLKTGAARIALSVASKTNFELDVQLLPAPISYIRQGEFRSILLVKVLEPIMISRFKEVYYQDPKLAVDTITAEIAKVMNAEMWPELSSENVLLTEDILEVLYMDIRQDAILFHENGKQIASTIGNWELTNDERLPRISELHKELVDEAKYYDISMADMALFHHDTSGLAMIGRLLGTTLLLPWMAAGMIIHLIPNFIGLALYRKSKIEIEYEATVKVLSGIVIYPLYYGGIVAMVWMKYGRLWACGFVLLAMATGFSFYPFLRFMRKTRAYMRLSRIHETHFQDVKIKIKLLSDLIMK